jgi:hypothetical protein
MLPKLQEYTKAELDAMVTKAQKEQGFAKDAESDAALRGALKGMNYYGTLQMEDGHWPGDYGGPMFLMPGLIITMYVTGADEELITPQHRVEMIRYLWNHQSPDGGWGLHIEFVFHCRHCKFADDVATRANFIPCFSTSSESRARCSAPC